MALLCAADWVLLQTEPTMNGASGFQEVLLLPPDHQRVSVPSRATASIREWFLAPFSPLAVFSLVVMAFFLPVEMSTSLPISVAVAAPPSSSEWACIELNVPQPRPAPLVVGCKLSDCGPGIDGPGPVDLRIALTGELAEKAILEFENMTMKEASRIAVRGNARHLKGTTRFEIRRGISTLRGFETTPHLRPPVATPHLTLNRKTFEAIKQAAKGDNLLATSTYPVTLQIDQFHGPITINKYSILTNFKLCPKKMPPSAPQGPGLEVRKFDLIDLGTGPLHKSLTLAPGRIYEPQYGCSDYGVERYEKDAGPIVPVNNHVKDEVRIKLEARMSSGMSYLFRRCHSEVVVYSESHALAVERPVTPPWTDEPGDHVPITLPPPLTVPITAWIIYDSTEEVFSNTHDTPEKVGQYRHDVSEQLKTDLRLAGDAFNYHPTAAALSPMCGIQFPDLTINTIDVGKLLKNDTDPLEIKNGRMPGDFTTVDPGDVEERYLKDISPMLYTEKHLNLYLLWGQANPDATAPAHSTSSIACQNKGWSFNCDAYGDMILLSSTDRDTLTLAHEIGHALSLEHVNFTSSNLMKPVTNSLDNHLTLGQCYRAHVDHTSHLNTEGIRTGPTLTDCPRLDASPGRCPDLSLD